MVTGSSRGESSARSSAAKPTESPMPEVTIRRQNTPSPSDSKISSKSKKSNKDESSAPNSKRGPPSKGDKSDRSSRKATSKATKNSARTSSKEDMSGRSSRKATDNSSPVASSKGGKSGRSSSARKTAKGLGKASTIPEEEEDAESMTRHVNKTAKRAQKLKKNLKSTRASVRLKKLDE